MRHQPLEHDDREQRDEPGLGAPAGIFLLEGGYQVAALGGRAVLRLRERGALLIAAVHFGPTPARN